MRRFGVEIEAGLQAGQSLSTVVYALQRAGLQAEPGRYTGHSMVAWQVKLDGSVSGGVEVVSPPLDFDDEAARGQVDTAVKAMQGVCRTLPSAGIHVHIESSDLSAEQVGSVARTFTHFEDVIYRIASSGWQTLRPGARSYCKPMTDAQVTALAKAKSDVAAKAAYYGSEANSVYASSHGHSSRYHGLNLHSHWFRGTIEFRVFNSSLNPMRVQTYIAVAMAIVQDARNGKKRSVAKAYRMGAMAGGNVDAAKLFFRFLTVVRYEAGMSLSDYRNLKKVWKDSRAQQSISGRW